MSLLHFMYTCDVCWSLCMMLSMRMLCQNTWWHVSCMCYCHVRDPGPSSSCCDSFLPRCPSRLFFLVNKIELNWIEFTFAFSVCYCKYAWCMKKIPALYLCRCSCMCILRLLAVCLNIEDTNHCQFRRLPAFYRYSSSPYSKGFWFWMRTWCQPYASIA